MQKQLAINFIKTPVGEIPVVPKQLELRDWLGTLKVLLNINRMKYSVNPGLYAVGQPNADSPVLVSANYKLSFDYLRKELQNMDAWIVVLDTKGINVWCAAGKGTFGTDELINQIKKTNIDQVVNHRKLIVPQLGAVGVSAHKVKEATGFKINYGPVTAKDIPAFIRSGNKATAEMRRVQFNFFDRLVLTPLEMVQGFRYPLIIMIVLFLLSGFHSKGYSIDFMLTSGFIALSAILAAFISGAALAPILLPFIPGRAFALKGFIINIPIFFLLNQLSTGFSNLDSVEKIAWFLIMSAISSFFAMNFTGASTYTSLSGVRREMRIAVPLQITASVTGLVLWIIKRFI